MADLPQQDPPVTTRQRAKALFSWRGRIGRLAFLAVLAHQLWWIGVIVGTMTLLDHGLIGPDAADWIARVAIILLMVGSWVVICAFIKRFHDIGWSGWWTLLLWSPAGPLVLLFLAVVPGEKNKDRSGPSAPPDVPPPPRRRLPAAKVQPPGSLWLEEGGGSPLADPGGGGGSEPDAGD